RAVARGRGQRVHARGAGSGRRPHRDAEDALRGLRGHLREAGGPAPPGAARRPAAERRRALALARPPHVPLVVSLGPVRISRAHWDELVAHARDDAPNECCGYLRASDGRVEEVFRAENERKSPYGYNFAF